MPDASWLELLLAVWFSAAAFAGPLVLAAVGETLSERSGVLNLGLEGVMAAGALVAYGVSAGTANAGLGLLAGTGAGLLLGAVHAGLVVELGADQVISGLGLTLGAAGTAAFLGPVWVGGLGAPSVLTELSTGRMALLLGYAPTTYLALLSVILAWWVLSRTRLGLAIRAVGDAPGAALALGISVRRVRWGCVSVGGALGGLAGAALALAYAHTWTSTMPAGLGWIVIALVPLSGWRPWRVLAFCLLLAAVSTGQLRLQILGVPVSSSLLEMLPYVATLVAVVAVRLGRAAGVQQPLALGRALD